MTRHQKRLAVPKAWPVERKGDTFTVKAGAGPHGEDGVPLLVLLRDVLGYVDSKKEARYALNQDTVLVNGAAVSDERQPIGMFDILAFTERGEFYRVFPGAGGRLALTPIDEDAAGSKLGKIVSKTDVPGGDVQLGLHDGRTLVADDTYGVGDSIVVDNEDGSIVAHFPYEEGSLVTAVRGGHAGEIGTVDEIKVTPGSAANNVLVSQDGGDGFETVEEYVVVIDENFTGGQADAGVEEAVETEDVEGEAEPEEVDEEAEAEEVDEEEAEAEEAEEKAEAEEVDEEAEPEDAEGEAEPEEVEEEAEAEEVDEGAEQEEVDGEDEPEAVEDDAGTEEGGTDDAGDEAADVAPDDEEEGDER